MSRFGPAKASGDRASSPVSKQPPSQVISPKKKAFVSTIKSNETFGVPPPLPPVNSPEGKWNLDQIVPDISYGVISDPDTLASSHVHLLQKQSVRWLNLSLNLWSLTVLDVYRTVSIESIAQFLEVISWRAHGKVTAEEFSVLYSEWVAKPDKVTSATLNSKRVTVGVFGVRQLLLERKYGEADLDLCIGILLHEINMRLLNSSVSYVNKKSTSNNQQNPFSLEVCSERWLALCEELFFTLDTPGYGVLHFDEAFFYCTCVTVGMQGWLSEEELEADLSLATLTATTLQFLSDTGASIQVRSHHHNPDLLWALEQQNHPNSNKKGKSANFAQFHTQSSSSYNKLSNGKCEITLSMFKRYFLKRNVGESSLAMLLSHVQGCIERIARLAKVNGAEELYQACRPYELELGSIGSARLWQQAVLSASGHVYQPSGETGASGSATSTTPPIILFLLSDAERLLSGALRANELPIDGTGFVGNDSLGATLMESPSAANEELHESVYRLWNQFRKWGTDSSATPSASTNLGSSKPSTWGLGSSASLHNPGSFFGHGAGQTELADVQRDPLYQLILTAVLQYKSLQQLLLAAFYDMALTYFGVGENNPAQGIAAGPLVVICAGLVSNPQKLLVDMGFTEDNSWTDTAGGIVGMRGGSAGNSNNNQLTPTRSDAADLGLSPSQDFADSYRSQTPEKDFNRHAKEESQQEALQVSNESIAGSVVAAPPARRRSSRASRGEMSDGELTTGTSSIHPDKDRPAELSKRETASSAARQRASQRIQEERRSAAVPEPAALSASVSIESEIAKAKWSPLFTSQRALGSSASDRENAVSKEQSTVIASKPQQSSSSLPSPPPKKASTTRLPAQEKSSEAIAPAAGSYSLSEQESALLAEILSTTDVAVQNDLIARMKNLRMAAPPAPTSSTAPRVTQSEESRTSTRTQEVPRRYNNRSDSENESNGFGQFQKLEENVLSEHDRRLSQLDAPPLSLSKPVDVSEPAAPSDLGSVGPSSVSL